MEHQAKWLLLRVLMMVSLCTPLVFLHSALFLLPGSLHKFLYSSATGPAPTPYNANSAGLQLEHSAELYVSASCQRNET